MPPIIGETFGRSISSEGFGQDDLINYIIFLSTVVLKMGAEWRIIVAVNFTPLFASAKWMLLCNAL